MKFPDVATLLVFPLVSLWFLFVCLGEITDPNPPLGDEGAHYDHALAIVNGSRPDPFGKGVYEHHGTLHSYYRAGVMLVLGADDFGFRMGGVLSAWLAALGLVWIGGIIVPRGKWCDHAYRDRTAEGRVIPDAPAIGQLAGSIFLLSHYLAIFAAIGYYNVDLLPPIVGIIGCSAQLARAQPKQLVWCTWAAGLVLCATVAFLLYPVPFNVDRFTGAYDQGVTGPPLSRMQWNIVHNTAAWVVDRSPTHYVRGTLVDTTTLVAAAVGALSTPSRLPLFWLLAMWAVAAVLSPHPSIATTRMFLMLPPLCLLAGIGAARVIEWAPGRWWLWASLLLTIIAYLNLERLV